MYDSWKPNHLKNELPFYPRRYKSFIPHWEVLGATYHIRLRLADAIPRSLDEQLQRKHLQRVERAREHRGELSVVELGELELRFAREIDDLLGQHRGTRFMAEPRIAAMVLDSALFFHEERYQLLATAVMPNHWHLVLRPIDGHEIAAIVKSMKQYTSREANRIRGTSGRNWQPDYFDRVMRNEDDLAWTIRYVLGKPVRAGLDDWKWIWPSSDEDARSR